MYVNLLFNVYDTSFNYELCLVLMISSVVFTLACYKHTDEYSVNNISMGKMTTGYFDIKSGKIHFTHENAQNTRNTGVSQFFWTIQNRRRIVTSQLLDRCN